VRDFAKKSSRNADGVEFLPLRGFAAKKIANCQYIEKSMIFAKKTLVKVDDQGVLPWAHALLS
jgi:hypothetical protein